MANPLLKPGYFSKSNVDFANRKIETLYQANWFSQVGKGSEVTSWEDAFEMATKFADYYYGDYLQDLSNEVRGWAADQDRALYDTGWGKAHDCVSEILMEFLEGNVFPKIPVQSLSKPNSNRILSGISGMMINQLCLALVYRLEYPPLEYHISQLTNGYYPCGYVGRYPTGRLIVF